MAKKRALLLGASGLTGGHLLKLLLQDETYEQVTVYARKHLKIAHNKMVEKIIDFETLDTAVAADDVFCCLGSTIKKAGSKEAFEKVDLDFPLKVAKLQKEDGSAKFLVISAMGANATSNIYYNQVKGKLEEGLKTVGFPSLYIFRPSVIVGKRNEKRIGEKLAVFLLKIINPLLIGPLRKYKSVKAKAIGAAMVYYANKNETGIKTVFSDEIKEFEL